MYYITANICVFVCVCVCYFWMSHLTGSVKTNRQQPLFILPSLWWYTLWKNNFLFVSGAKMITCHQTKLSFALSGLNIKMVTTIGGLYCQTNMVVMWPVYQANQLEAICNQLVDKKRIRNALCIKCSCLLNKLALVLAVIFYVLLMFIGNLRCGEFTTVLYRSVHMVQYTSLSP